MLNDWQMVTLVQDALSGTRSIYIDGELADVKSDPVNSVSDAPLVMGGTGGPVIGGSDGAVTEDFKGLLDEVKL